MNDKAGDSLHVDLAVLHHIPLLGLSLLFLSLPFSFVHTSSFLFSLFRQGRGKGEIRERGSISSIFSVPCFVFPSPLLISLLFLSLLFLLRINPVYLSSSFSLLPSPFSSPTKKHKKRQKHREMEALFFSYAFSMVGESDVAPVHASAYPSPCPISSVLSIVPKRKRKRVPFIFIVLPLVFYFKGKRTREKKDKKERKDEDEYHLLFATGKTRALASK